MLMVPPLVLSVLMVLLLEVPLLVYAAMKGQDTVVEWLLAKRADPDQSILSDPTQTDADRGARLRRERRRRRDEVRHRAPHVEL